MLTEPKHSGRRAPVRFGLVAISYSVTIAAFAAMVGTPPAGSSDRDELARIVPASTAQKGMIYSGLSIPKAGTPCAGTGLYGVGDFGCTHGPDAPAAGVDISQSAAPLSPAAIADAPAIACDGDGTSGNRTEVLYVRDSDHADRYATYATSIAAWAAEADDIYYQSAVETGGTRRIRFVHTAGCEIIVRNVVLSPGGNQDIYATAQGLSALGYNRVDRKYMAFVDANVYCGVGFILSDDQPGQTNANNFGPTLGRSDSGCWDGGVAAHEHNHNLGGVQLSAPHTSNGWHCVDEYDRMCYSDSPNYPSMQYLCTSSGHDARFDCNHDDYYSTNPAPGSYLATHWNTANSQFLIGGGPSTTAPGAPTVTSSVAGHHWAVVGWTPPTTNGGSPITTYTVVASTGQTSTVPASASRAVVTGLANGIATTFRVRATNSVGTGPLSAASASRTPNTGVLNVTSRYNSTERARLVKSANYYGVTPKQFQHDAVAGLAYIFALGADEITPMTPPAQTGGIGYSTAWPGNGQGSLVDVSRRLALTPGEAQYTATGFIGYLLALGGH